MLYRFQRERVRKGITYKCYDNKLLILDNSLSRAQKAKVNRDVGLAHREELPKVDEGEKKKNRAAKRIRRKLTKKAQKAQKAQKSKAEESSDEEETEHEADQLVLEDSDLEAAMQED